MNAYHSLDSSMDKIIVDSFPPTPFIFIKENISRRGNFSMNHRLAITSRDIKITGVRMIKDTRYDGKVGKGKERERETREEKMVGCKSLR